MKIYLTKDNVLEILCKHFGIPYIEVDDPENKVIPRKDEIYWEGNPEKCRPAPGTSLKE